MTVQEIVDKLNAMNISDARIQFVINKQIFTLDNVLKINSNANENNWVQGILSKPTPLTTGA